jgi:hypothetical protein
MAATWHVLCSAAHGKREEGIEVLLVSTKLAVEFGNARSSQQAAAGTRAASFERALTEADGAEHGSDDSAATDAVEDRDRETDAADDAASDAEAERPPRDESGDDERRDEEERPTSDARVFDLRALPDAANDHAVAPAARRKGQAWLGANAAAVARSARTFATEPLAASPAADGKATGSPATAAPASAAAQPAIAGTAHGSPAEVQLAVASDGRAHAAGEAAAPSRGRAGAAHAAPARFIDPRTLQAIESARESVFRQIALRVTPEGGEMRLLLDPPELGELDLQMVVEKGSAMRMVVVAERPEMASMIERHLDELRSALESQGITVTDASVHARDDHSARRQLFGGGDARRDDRGVDGDQRTDASPSRRGGYISSEGLDFWV